MIQQCEMTTDSRQPKLIVTVLTHNHELYLEQTLESIVSQEVDFLFEVHITDNASTDGTVKIIQKYAQDYPHLITTFYNEENIHHEQIYFDILRMTDSEYLLFTDGDDYFTDPHKLQKQVDFLDNNPDFSLCFHPVEIIFEDENTPPAIFPTEEERFGKEVLTLDDLLEQNFIQTSSCMYRWVFSTKADSEAIDGDTMDPNASFPRNIMPGDYWMNLLHAEKGKIGFLPDMMSVFRKHEAKAWAGLEETDEWFVNYGLMHANFYLALEQRYNKAYTNLKEFMFTKTLIVAMNRKSIPLLEVLLNQSGYYYDELLLMADRHLEFLSFIRAAEQRLTLLRNVENSQYRMEVITRKQ